MNSTPKKSGSRKTNDQILDDAAGFSLIEAMIAVAILGVAIFIVQNVLSSSTKMTVEAIQDARAESFELLLRGQLYETARTRLNQVATNSSPGCAPSVRDSDGKLEPSTANGAKIGLGECYDASWCKNSIVTPTNGPRFGAITIGLPMNAIQILRLINHLNRYATPSGAADSAETYMFPIWKQCMTASINGMMNNYTRCTSLPATATTCDININQSQCLPLAGYEGYAPVPSVRSDIDPKTSSLLREGRMGYFKAELWDFALQQQIACSDAVSWKAAAVRGFRINYAIMWQRQNGIFKAKSGVIDVYDQKI